MITVALLVSCGVAPTQARLFADPLKAACLRFGIDTRPRVAAFLAQIHHESAGLTRVEENLYYTSPERIRAVWPTRVATLNDAAKLCRNPKSLASKVYANRLGNGSEESGDGWKYRGRGLIQLTGKSNYLLASAGLDADYVKNPDWVARVDGASLTAAWFWTRILGNELADSSQIDLITKRINGPAMLGADERRSRYDDNLRALA
jgi:putative chitinase